MGKLICIYLVLSFAFYTCKAQDSAASSFDELESFVLQLLNTPPQQRTELLAANPKLITTGLRQKLVRRGNNLLVDGKYAPALDVYSLAQKVAEQIGDKEGLATTALDIGSVYYFQGNYELALERYRKAQELFTSLANRSEAAKSLYGLALTYQAQRKLPDALKSFEQALSEFEALNDRNEIADTLAGIGSIQYAQGNYEAATKTLLRVSSLRETGDSFVGIAEAFYRQTDYAQALIYYQRSLESFEREKNVAGVVAALIGIANCYYLQGNYDEALAVSNRSLTLVQNLKDQSGIATQLQSIGNIYRARGDYGSALQNYFESLNAAATATTQATVATTLGNIGLVRALQADNAQAIEYFQKSLKAFETNGDQVGMARMLSSIGNVRFTQGLYDQALEAYEKSLELYQARTDNLNQAHLLLGIGAVYLNQQKYPSALEKYQQALAIYESLGRTADIAGALTEIAGAHRLQNEYEKGLEFANRAVNLAKSNDLPSILWVALTETGRLQQGLTRQTEALNAFTEAIRIQESNRTESTVGDVTTDTSGVLPYLGAMEVLIDQNNAGAALQQSENAKSEALREIIQRGNFKITKDMTPAEQKEESRLLGDLASLKLQLKGIQERDSSERAGIKALQTRLAAARGASESFRKQLYRKHPQLAVYRGELPPLKIEGIRPLLHADEAVLEYAITTDKLFLFVVTAGENTNSPPPSRKRLSQANAPALVVNAYPLAAKPSQIAELSTRFRQSIANRDQSSAETARQLYDILLKPAEPQIETKSKLIIVPDGVVWDVPFVALQPAETQYLIDRKTVSYAISISALKEMRKRRLGRPVPAATLLAFGNPTLSDQVMERINTTYKGLYLHPTPGESEEIQKLQTIYGKTRSHFYNGAGATEERAKAEANSFSTIHFATPTILDEAVPLYSFVVLSADPKVPDDGLLRLWEVFNLNSKAKVAVFPSAASAQSESRSANGLIAMSWAWFVAGTPTVMLSRWNVDEALIPEFTAELHRRLRSSNNKSGPDSNAEALRQSTLKLRQSLKDDNPHDWSGFMVMGDP